MFKDPKTGCINCEFSELQHMPPPQLGKQRVCLWGPPQVIVMPTPQGMMLASTPATVLDAYLCSHYQRDPQAADIETKSDDLPASRLKLV